MNEIPVFKPLIEAAEIAAAVESLELGWLGMGSYVGRFEDAIRAYIDAPDRHVVAVNTGHSALHLALLIAGIGPGDEVVTPSFNNISDFQAIRAVGAEPVFCDIDDETLCIDVAKAEELIGPRTKAVIAMDYGLHICDHQAVAELAGRRGVRVIHDAAHSFGSTYRGRPVGGFSDMTMLSFDPVKTVTAIDGGALIVRTEEEADRLRRMRLLGMGQSHNVMYQNRRAWTYDVEHQGFRYHLPNLHAAVGLAQLAKIDRIIQTRREAVRHYQSRLSNLPELRLPRANLEEAVPFLYYVRVPNSAQQEFRDRMAELGVDTGVHWQPGHWFSLLKDHRRGDLSVTERVGREIVTLPLHSDMPIETIDKVCNAVESSCIIAVA